MILEPESLMRIVADKLVTIGVVLNERRLVYASFFRCYVSLNSRFSSTALCLDNAVRSAEGIPSAESARTGARRRLWEPELVADSLLWIEADAEVVKMSVSDERVSICGGRMRLRMDEQRDATRSVCKRRSCRL